LQMNRSTQAQVIAFAGRPSILRVARDDGRIAYQVLGYGCLARAGTKKYWSSYPIECRTTFYFVDGRLSLFITQDRRFAEAGGVRIGTPTKRAERLLHQRGYSGCVAAIRLQRKRSWLTVSLGGKIQTVGAARSLVGGYVDGFYLHGRRNTGATDCD
jgi:hypothetical protein